MYRKFTWAFSIKQSLLDVLLQQPTVLPFNGVSLCCFAVNPIVGTLPKGDAAAFAKVVREVIDAGAVPRFVEFLQRDDDHALQLESAWVLTTIANGRSDHVQVVVEAGAVPILVRLVISSTDDICEQAVSLLV